MGGGDMEDEMWSMGGVVAVDEKVMAERARPICAPILLLRYPV